MTTGLIDHVSPAAAPEQSIVDFSDQDPFAFYERIRAHGEPVWDEKAQAWLVVNYRQCADIQRDESRFVVIYADADETLRRIKGGGANIILSQGQEHKQLRKLHLRLLTPASVKRYQKEHLAPILDMMMARLEGRDRAELSSELAEQIPPRLICSLLGMPYDDDAMIARILELNDHIVNFIASGYSGDALRDRALAASVELNEMLLPYVRARRDDPREDFISRVWLESGDMGLELDEEAALGLCRELYFAGSDTTVHGINSALYLLLSDPEAMRRAQQEPVTGLAPVIEEALRLFNVVQFRHRKCIADTEIGGVLVRSGEVVILAHAGANRDPAKFGCPNSSEYMRKSPTDHLAFGQGNRACVGSQLARAEIRDTVLALLARFPGVHLDSAAPPPFFRGIYMRSMGPLHVRLDATPPSATSAHTERNQEAG